METVQHLILSLSDLKNARNIIFSPGFLLNVYKSKMFKEKITIKLKQSYILMYIPFPVIVVEEVLKSMIIVEEVLKSKILIIDYRKLTRGNVFIFVLFCSLVVSINFTKFGSKIQIIVICSQVLKLSGSVSQN